MFECGSLSVDALGSVLLGADETVAAALESGPGPWSTVLLSSVDVADLSDVGRLDYIKALEQLASWASAMAVPAIVDLVGQDPIPYSAATAQDNLAQEAAVVELELALGASSRAVEDRVGVARDLTDRLTNTLTAVLRGEVSYQQARALSDVTSTMNDQDASEVEAYALDTCRGRSLPDWRRRCRERADRLDPERAVLRHRKAAAERTMTKWREPDGMATLEVKAPAPDIEAIWGALTILAGPTDADDPRPIGARRVDTLLGLCIGAVAPDPATEAQVPSRVVARPTIPTQAHIVIDLPTLLGLAENSCELVGYGEIPAGVARDWLHHATSWRRLVTDPVDGHLLDLGPTVRFPTKRLRGYVQARDGTCVFPGCRHPAHRSDVDHRLPWQENGGGGSTSAENLASLCRRHHRLKTFARWVLRRLVDGSFEWTSPSGRKWVVRPRRVLGDEGSTPQG